MQPPFYRARARRGPLEWARIRRIGTVLEIVVVAVLLLATWLVVKVAGFLLKAMFFVVVFAALYWLAAPHFGLPLPPI